MRPRPPSALRTALVLALAAAWAAPAAAQGPTYFGRNKVQYEGFDWQVLRTEHFDVYHPAEAGELAEIGAHEAEAAFRDLTYRFNYAPRQRIPLVFYASNLHFRQTNTTPGFIPPGVGGFFEFLKGRVVIPADGDLGRFRRVIRHELVHVFTFNRIAGVHRDHRRPLQALPPLWFTEGLAEYWSGEADHQHEMILRDAVASNYLVPLEQMDRIGGYLVYKQGEAACRFLAETYGEETLRLLIDNVWRELDFRKVIEHVLREPFRETSDRFDAWVRERYYPMLEEGTPAALTAPPVAVGGFHGKPVLLPSGEGGTVAYVANRGGYTNLYGVAVDAEGRPLADPRVLVRGERGPRFEAFHPFESRMDVGPDGRLAFSTQSGATDVLHLYDPAEGRVEATYRFPDLVALYSPAWRLDGGALAFTGIARSGFADLYVYDLHEETLRRLTADAYNDRDPAWHPEGGALVFSSDRTPFGEGGAANLFTLDLDDGRVRSLTHGDQVDLSPRFSPDGRYVVFASARRGEDGAFGAQDLWVVEAEPWPGEPADAPLADASPPAETYPLARGERRLTAFTGAAMDPVWTDDGTLLFSTYDGGRFTIRRLGADSLLAAPREVASVPLDPPPVGLWAHPRLALGEYERLARRPYRRAYSLDVAQGGVQTNPVWGTSGGAVLAFSDLLGDDRLLVTFYSADVPGRRFVDGLNVGLTRVHLGRRANVGYGAFRYSGLRYDRTDPDADATYPVLFEQLAGGFGVVSYPLSRFQRVEVTGSLAFNRKEVTFAQVERDALLYTQHLALTHDNALYGYNGPLDGWKAQVGAGYTTDLRYSNVSYYTLSADVRRYTRLFGDVSLASWGLVRTNVGREARLFLLGGSWDLRGFPFLRVRGQNQWFTSHELRFPIAYAPSAYVPLLAPFGILNLRGALFADAAHAWNDGYRQREPQLLTGRTLGALGGGLRMNLFGGIVLRYDLGWRFEDGLDWGERRQFRQFFFGYDF